LRPLDIRADFRPPNDFAGKDAWSNRVNDLAADVFPIEKRPIENQ
jgi:hypothetical protein